jgi:hypothetical protein
MAMRSQVVLFSIASVTLLVAAPMSGRAQTLAEGNGPAPRPNTICLDLGVASAVGELGITFARTFGDLIQIEAGVGIGDSGTHLSLMPKIVLGNRALQFVAGVGLSVAIPRNPLIATGHPTWLNVDAAGLQLISSQGVTFLAAVGITEGLGGGNYCTNFFDGCEPGEKFSSVAGVWGPQFRIAWGYSF